MNLRAFYLPSITQCSYFFIFMSRYHSQWGTQRLYTTGTPQNHQREASGWMGRTAIVLAWYYHSSDPARKAAEGRALPIGWEPAWHTGCEKGKSTLLAQTSVLSFPWVLAPPALQPWETTGFTSPQIYSILVLLILTLYSQPYITSVTLYSLYWHFKGEQNSYLEG